MQVSWNLNVNLRRAYLNDIPNFLLIGHKRAEIHSREVNRELCRKKWKLRHCDHNIQPKVTNFNRARASVISNRLSKTKSVHPFGWNFVHWHTHKHTTHTHHTHTHTHTDTQTDTHTDKLQWKYNSTISWTQINFFGSSGFNPMSLNLWHYICDHL